MKKCLNFLATAIGSLPHTNTDEAVNLIFDTIPNAPLCPQLSKFNRKEDMMIQYTENFPGIKVENNQYFADLESDEYFSALENLFMDFEEIISSDVLNGDILTKYAISEEYNSSLPVFLKKLKTTQPKYIKGQVIGPFTFGTSTFDTEKRCVFYDETYREVITKILTLKALWQVFEYKKVSPDSEFIIFLDEPAMSQLGTSAYMTVTKDDVQYCINQITDTLHKYNITVGMHCCGKTDWQILLDTNLDLINFDAYSYSENFSLFAPYLKNFLNKGGIVAWGIVPTLNSQAVQNATADSLLEMFENGKNMLIAKGIEEDKILQASMITPSCGAGSLNKEDATRTMKLLKEVSEKLQQRYSERLK